MAASPSMIHGRGDHFTRAVGASSISPCHPLGKVVSLARPLTPPSFPPLSFFPSSGCVYLSEFSGYSARNSSCWPPLLPLSLPLLPLRRKGQTRDGKCRDGFFALAPVKLGSLLRAGNVFFHSPSGRIAISYECEPRNEEEDMHGYDG